MHEATLGGKYDLIQQEQVIKARDIADLLEYLQFADTINSNIVNTQLHKRGIFHTPGYTRSGEATLQLITFLHAWLTRKGGHDTDRVYTVEFSRALQRQIDQLQATVLWSAAQSVVVDFSHNVMETIRQDGNTIEWTFVQWQWKIDAVLQDETLPPPQKQSRLQEVAEQWLTQTPMYIDTLWWKLRSYLPQLDIHNFPALKKITLVATIVGTLLYTTKHVTLQEVASLSPHARTEEPTTKEALRSTIATATSTHTSSQPSVHKQAHKPAWNTIATPTRDKTTVVPHEQQQSVIKIGEERPMTEFSPLPTKQIKEVFSSTPTHMKKINVWGYMIYRDPVSGVYYRKIQSGETLGELRSALAQDERFAYLEHRNYKPRSDGNVLSRNIDADNLPVGKLIPIPLDREETQLSDSELRSSAQEALQTMVKHQRYGAFMQHLTDELGEEHLIKVMCAVAKKESDQWATSMYRYEPGHGKFSYGIYHVLDSGPGMTALSQLHFSSWQVMANPAKAGQWFRAYCYEKLTEMRHSKTYADYIAHPEKLFKKRSLAKFWKIYNGSADYGKELKKIFNTLQ
jgi:hypothetical protein